MLASVAIENCIERVMRVFVVIEVRVGRDKSCVTDKTVLVIGSFALLGNYFKARVVRIFLPSALLKTDFGEIQRGLAFLFVKTINFLFAFKSLKL